MGGIGINETLVFDIWFRRLYRNLIRNMYECLVCKTPFNSLLARELHMQSVHYNRTMRPPIICLWCGEQFADGRALHNHINSSHSG